MIIVPDFFEIISVTNSRGEHIAFRAVTNIQFIPPSISEVIVEFKSNLYILKHIMGTLQINKKTCIIFCEYEINPQLEG